jgi:phosphoenolpyruvate synthase/pyruvate phosphate dikinase
VKDVRDIEKVLNITGNTGLGAALKAAIPAFGGKASHFAAFPHMDTLKVPFPKACVIPLYYYFQFMKQNGFDKVAQAINSDPIIKNSAAKRDSALGALQNSMMKDGVIDSAFENMLMTKLATKFPNISGIRFRSSTNGEDLEGFTGAGLFTSTSGNPTSVKSIRKALRTVWASVWRFKAFEERAYRNIDHMAIGMALLVHHSSPNEASQGVAITANPFDPSQLEPAFYINGQAGSSSVVLPDARVKSEELIYFYDNPGQPVTYLGRSNLIPDTSYVLSRDQVRRLGNALAEIHQFFLPLYGADKNKFYGMDTEWKFDRPPDNPNGPIDLYMKQCRPFSQGE